MSDIRSFWKWKRQFADFGREERNLTGVFYHTLLQPGNLEKFLQLINSKQAVVQNEFGVYLEYTYLRDLWHCLSDDEQKRELITTFVRLKKPDNIAYLNTPQFNEHFGVVSSASRTHIQSPGRWSLKKYHHNFRDNDDLLNVSKFKWSFNAKPDVVIHTSVSSCICIEAKLESREGSYPQDSDEKKIFNDRGLHRVGQTDLQRFMMKELLGYETEFVFLVKNAARSSGGAATVQWCDVFDILDLSTLASFMKTIIKSQLGCDGHGTG